MANKNVFINWVNTKMIHAQTATATGKEFSNISVPCDESVTGFATIAVNNGQILPCTKKDGTEMSDYKNILLGSEGKTHKVSICVKKGKTARGTKYETRVMKNEDICKMIADARKAYRAAQQTATEAATE